MARLKFHEERAYDQDLYHDSRRSNRCRLRRDETPWTWEVPDEPEQAWGECVDRLGDRGNQGHDTENLLRRELDLRDQRWQQIRVSYPETEEEHSDDDQSRRLTRRENEKD